MTITRERNWAIVGFAVLAGLLIYECRTDRPSCEKFQRNMARLGGGPATVEGVASCEESLRRFPQRYGRFVVCMQDADNDEDIEACHKENP